jgi:hypothetical protein
LDIQRSKVLENGWSTENDVAILELAEKPPKWIRPIIMQSSQAMEGRAFQGLGYLDNGPVQTRWPQGNISGKVEVEEYTNPLLQLQGKEIDEGLSGSAGCGSHNAAYYRHDHSLSGYKASEQSELNRANWLHALAKHRPDVNRVFSRR